ncbi:hypothetical protein [Otariodibacter oris]|uniref:Outer membrane protein n=1 Tax=Otariodibacter oris TaxID=1032623 RepID=A0A420XI81_9PAST|nr:hypothetical protein [Otariodibacter oris]QGM80751.1 hypothetical protein A6A10_04690 [Otariodibacter oris]RKR77084.1 hypothetical protein DES31_0405 [Otariodibacter oris]
MKLFYRLALLAVSSVGYIVNAVADDLNLKYSTNYLMPAYVHFNNNAGKYKIESRINIPLYKIQFIAQGRDNNSRLSLDSYKDVRNGKNYAIVELGSNSIQYGKVKEPLKKESLSLPTFDLFSLVFQLSYYDKLPSSFQTTNGKKLYPSENVNLDKSQAKVKLNGKDVDQITYKFRADDKFFTIKKLVGEKFPRYVLYTRDDDKYELTFDGFVQ